MTPAEAADILKRYPIPNHEEAEIVAIGRLDRSNLARCYIDLAARLAAIKEIIDIARGLTIERDPDRGVYVGVTGDHKDAEMLDEAFAKLDGRTPVPVPMSPPISENDLYIEWYRPPGASLHTHDSGVRITHKPTGIDVSCHEHRGKYHNYSAALAALQRSLTGRGRG